MTKNNRPSGSSSWTDSSFVERERTFRSAIEVGIRLHLARLSLSNTERELEKLGVDRSRTGIHKWVQKADLQPTSDATPSQIAVDETVIRVNGERCWLYAAVNPANRSFGTRELASSDITAALHSF